MPNPISLREFVSRMKMLGFKGPFPGGRHMYMSQGSLKVRIPNRHGGDISVSLLIRILKQAGISKNTWESL